MENFKDSNALWFLFQGNKLLVKVVDNGVRVLSSEDIKGLEIELKKKSYISVFDQTPCYAAELGNDLRLPDKFAFYGLRQLLEQLDESIFTAAGKGYQIIHWERINQYCGRCGTPNRDKVDERAKQCPNCGLITYPRISPAVIVAIIKGNSILLARNKNFAGNYYSVISGFVEPGETFEECVKREVKEEVGINVKNIRYFGSQPWPFPDSLMVGFIAEYEGGEIKVDNEEIVKAAWFTAGDLPNVPPKNTIAKDLVDWFIKNKAL